MGIEFTVDHWAGSLQGKQRTAFMLHTVITLRGVPAEVEGWGDMGLFAPTLCLEVETLAALSGNIGGSTLGWDLDAPRPVKRSLTSRKTAIRRGYVGESIVLRGPDLRALFSGLPASTLTSHWDRLDRAAGWLDGTVLADAARATGARRKQIDAFLASLPVAA